jgi:hypothetical protein
MQHAYYVNAGTFQRKIVADCAVNAAIRTIRDVVNTKSIGDEQFYLLLPKYIIIHERGFRCSERDTRHGDKHFPVVISSEYVIAEIGGAKQ